VSRRPQKPARQLGRPVPVDQREEARKHFDVRDAMERVCPQILRYRYFNPVLFPPLLLEGEAPIVMRVCDDCGERLDADGECPNGCDDFDASRPPWEALDDDD
jgi:hypothetical protein